MLFVLPGSAGRQAARVKAKGDALLKPQLLLEQWWAALYPAKKTSTVEITMCKTTLPWTCADVGCVSVTL